MASSFGGTVKLSGESEYRKALSQITTELKLMSSQMQIVTATYGKNDSSVDSLTSKNKILIEQVDKQKEKISVLKDALEQAKKEYGENSSKTNEWQTKLNKAQAELINMNKEIANNDKSLKNNRERLNELNVAINDLTQKYVKVCNEEGKHSNSAKSLKSQLNELAKQQKSLGQAIEEEDKQNEKVTKSLKLYSDETKNAEKNTLSLGDVIKANLISDAIVGGIKSLGSAIGSLANAFKDSLKDGIAYNSMIEDYTMSFTTMTGSADKAEEMMNEIKKTAKETPFEIDGMADSVKQMMSYGIEADKSIELTKLLGDVSQGNMDKMNSLAYAMGQISSAGKLNAQDLRQLINAGFNPLEEISQRTGESMESLKEKMSNGEVTYEMVEDSLKAITGEGGRFENAMINASKTFSGQTAMLEEGWNNLKGMMTEGISSILADSVLPMINGWLDQLTSAFETDGISGVISVMSTILQEAIAYIVEQIPAILNVASQIITSLVQGIALNLPMIITGATQIIMQFINTIIQLLPTIIESGINMLVSLVQGIAQSLPQLIPTIIDAVILIVETLLDNIDLIIDAGISIILGLAEGLINALPKLIDKIPVIIEKLITAITTNLPKITAMGIELTVKLAVGLIKAIPQLVAKIPEIITALVKGLANGVKSMATVGLDLIKGLWEGIKNAKDWVVSKIKGFMGDVLGGIKKFFGINSPSTVFKDQIGKNLALGIGEGFSDEMGTVVKDMENNLPTDFDLGVNTSLSNNITSSLNQPITNDSLVIAFQTALKGMSVLLDGDKIGELIVDEVEKVVFS